MIVQNFTTEELESEEWRDIPGYVHRYRASSLGRIKRVQTGRILKPSLSRGYPYVQLYSGTVASAKVRRVHQLVALAFLGQCPRGHEVNHIDTDRQG
jgi:hypothetical protein